MSTYTLTAEMDEDLTELSQAIGTVTVDDLAAWMEGDTTGTDYVDADGHLSDEGRETLMYQAASVEPHDLYDSDTNELVRQATVDETVASYKAGAEGHIEVDGRTVYAR